MCLIDCAISFSLYICVSLSLVLLHHYNTEEEKLVLKFFIDICLFYALFNSISVMWVASFLAIFSGRTSTIV